MELKILAAVEKLIEKNKVKGLIVKLVPSTEERCAYQVEIIDSVTAQCFGLMANNVDDVKSLFPRLLNSLISIRGK